MSRSGFAHKMVAVGRGRRIGPHSLVKSSQVGSGRGVRM